MDREDLIKWYMEDPSRVNDLINHAQRLEAKIRIIAKHVNSTSEEE